MLAHDRASKMTISEIEALAQNVAKTITSAFIVETSESYAIEYDRDGSLRGDFERHFSHRGIYGFRVSRDGKVAIAYIGKAENDGRLRQHLMSKNKNGTPLSSSTRTKHEKIKDFIGSGFSVSLCLFSDPAFCKSSLSCIEIASALLAKQQLEEIFPSETHWNLRIG
jgi:hypothetical protein